MKPFPLIEVSGPAYERGFQHGRAGGDLIWRYVSILRQSRTDAAQARGVGPEAAEIDDDELARRALLFLPWFERFAPEQVEEIRGIAAGAGLPFGLALLANVRGEVFRAAVQPVGCTAVALGRQATADGAILLGQNQDQSPAMQDLVVILRVIPERGPRILMATFGGLIGYGGINSAGVGHMMNALANSTWRMGLPHYPLKRALLEQTDLASCLGLYARAPVCSSANQVLVDRDQVADLELVPEGPERLEPHTWAGDYVVHTNHFLSERLVADEQYLPRLPDSMPRYRRMEALIRERYGRLTLSDLKAFFADHAGFPQSICRHAEAGNGGAMKSIYSVIGEPDRGRLHVSAGNPCESEYFTYEL
ncbi:MAG: C45 family autoproteolytic acyltransferase/hydrolase [Chloroflexota bacterium]